MKNSAEQLPPLLRIGFRPFFLGASLWALLSILLWMCNLFGLSGHFIGGSEIPAFLWHGHEMVFGFVFAVTAGFLLTASANWTGTNPASGLALAFLVFCWMGGRIFFYTGNLSLAACSDLCADFGVLIAVARVILRARLWRNLMLLLLLALPAFLNLYFYVIEISSIPFDPALATEGSLGVFFIFILLIAGRIIPIFSSNAISNLHIQPKPLLDRLSLLFGALALLLWTFSAYTLSPFMADLCRLIFGIAAILHFWRFLNWKPWRAHQNGMIFALYLSYGWVIVSFFAMILESFALILRSMNIHFMGLGAISMAIAAMICRVSRGHTGRPIVLGKIELLFFVMMTLAALLRLIASFPSFMAQQTLFISLLMGSASCFILGFAAFLFCYAPFLCTNRADGKKG
ncbi:NnrS family protein [Acetobacteraceae bacterium]|nr:NnrS family protein [Acetobacteraceae bacterium]